MRSLLAISPLLILSACGTANSGSSVVGTGDTRSFAVGAFDAVSVEGSDNVRVVRGTTTSVAAAGPAKTLEKLDIRVEGTTLKIGRKRQSWGMGWSSGDGAVVTVTMPSIRAANVAGSGGMTLDRADGDAFAGSVAGSGAMQIAALAVKRAKLSVAGSGGLMAAGASDESALSVAGSGNLDATKLQSRRADISVSGSGDLNATATESAAISMVGSGDVVVTGTDKCAISRVGSGDARCSR